MCLTAIVATAGWGAIQAYIASRISHAVEDRFWHLTEKQQNDLGRELEKVPADQRFTVTIHIVQGNAQALTLAEDLTSTFTRHGWIANRLQDFNLRADLIGIIFVFALDFPRTDKDLPPHASELAHMFDNAEIKYTGGWQQGFADNSLLLAIGSRPPNW